MRLARHPEGHSMILALAPLTGTAPALSLDAARLLATLLVEFVAIFLTISFLVHVLVQSVSHARLQRMMHGRPLRSTVIALGLGAVTPFCSCSTVPVVAGMAAAGVPVAALTAFLVLSPLVNPATVALLAALASPLHAAAFVVASMLLALVVAGCMVVLGVRPRASAAIRVGGDDAQRPWPTRLRQAGSRSWRDLRRIVPLLAAVAAIGALLYGRVDVGTIGRAIDAAGPWAVPVAVLVGVPVYASTAVLLPLGSALLATGANLGVVTAFLIGATGLSLPEGVLLHRLLGGRYLVVLATAFVLATIALGLTIQWLAPGAFGAAGAVAS
jgi:uncharacterized protein